MKYYLYALLDPRKPGRYDYNLNICFLYEPFYIGKGCGSRIKAHLYPSQLKIKSPKNSKIKSIINSDLNIISEILQCDLTQNEAFDLEIMCISKIGRMDLNTGCLTNLTDGKDGSNLIVQKTRKPVVKINVETKEIIEDYASISEAAIKNNTSISNISTSCKSKIKIHLGYYWRFKVDNENIFESSTHKKIIHEFDYNTGELLHIYDSIKDAALYNKTATSVIINCCKNILIKFNNKYFRYADNIFPKTEKKKTFKKIVYIENDIPIFFDSVKACAAYVGCTCKCVHDNCVSTKILSYEMYYLSDWNNIRKLKSKDEKCVEIIVKNIITLEVIQFKSITEAANTLNINRSVIQRSIKQNSIYKKQYIFIRK